MARTRKSVAKTIEWLSFPQQAYPNLYLNRERIRHRFLTSQGAIREFSKTVARSAGANAKVKAVFAEAGVDVSGESGQVVTYDVADPLAQVLILRANLDADKALHRDPVEASVTDFVLARGSGGLITPAELRAGTVGPGAEVIPPEAAEELLAEHRSQVAISTEEDTNPTYWGGYVATQHGLAVSLLGAASIVGTEVRTWKGREMTYCIFGTKVSDWSTWTLVSPLHVWIEQPGKSEWG